MVSLRTEQTRRNGVTLVSAVLDNDGPDPRYVELRATVDGPVWPPRRRGRPERGWSDEGYAGVVDPGTHGFGFATSGTPGEPPLVVETVAPPDERPDEDSAADVLREWGDPRPPREVASMADVAGDEQTTGDVAMDLSHNFAAGDAIERDGDRTRQPSGATASQSSDGATDSASEQATDPLSAPASDLPPAVRDWLAERERRVALAERLQQATTRPERAAAVDAAGGPGAVDDLAAALPEDRETLAAVADAVESVRRRAASVDPSALEEVERS